MVFGGRPLLRFPRRRVATRLLRARGHGQGGDGQHDEGGTLDGLSHGANDNPRQPSSMLLATAS